MHVGVEGGCCVVVVMVVFVCCVSLISLFLSLCFHDVNATRTPLRLSCVLAVVTQRTMRRVRWRGMGGEMCVVCVCVG